MRKFYYFVAVVAVVITSCQQEVVYHGRPSEEGCDVSVGNIKTRTYDEAFAIAEDALKLLDGEDTRSAKKRVIKRDEGQVVMRPVTRGSETSEEPIMYVFNNEDNLGFTIVAADRSVDPVIAVTEYGNYTYGEPTGVEPFDILMDDVTISLMSFEDEPYAIIKRVENQRQLRKYGPQTTVQWGTGTIYGSLYPDGIAYDEAAAIAQILLATPYTDTTYTITNPNDELYGQTMPINKSLMATHLRHDYHGSPLNPCTQDIHDQIARLYLEIGYRLSNGTSISLSNKTASFSFSKVHEVLESFGADLGPIRINGDYLHPVATNVQNYDRDVFVFKGVLDQPSSKQSLTWVAVGYYLYSYDDVELTLNYLIDPNSPDPYGYTETSRVVRYGSMDYMNWGYDGYSNGWFKTGCYDMSQRQNDVDHVGLGGILPTLSYRYVNINWFEVNCPFYGQI